MSNLIDRQQAIEAICMETCGVSLKNERCMVHCTEVQAVEKLPPAEPMVDIRDTQYNLPVGTDTISRAKAIEALDKRFDSIPMEQTSEILMLRKDLRELPPAQPKRGKWILDGHHVRCDQCGTHMCNTDREGDPIPRFFCPNCGADMREVTE